MAAVGATLAASWGSGAPFDALRFLDLCVGLLLLGTGMWAATRNGSLAVGWCLVLAGAMWFAGNLAESQSALSAWGQRGLFLHRAALVAAPVVAVRGQVGVGFGVAVAGSTLIEPLMRDPGLSVLWSAAVATAALFLLRRVSPRRPVGWPEAAVALLMGTVATAAAILATGPESGPAGVVVYLIGVAGTALVIGYGTGAWRRAGPLPDAMVEVATGSGGPIGSRLRLALGDPDADVAFSTPSGWVDDVGRPRAELREQAGRALVDVVVDEALVARISVAQDSVALPRVVSALEVATAAASEHVRLTSALRAEASEIAESRRRLVLATDEQRHELAQALDQYTTEPLQRARLALDLADQTPDETLRARASAGRERLDLLLQDLHSLASGLGPVALTTAGLQDALVDLADRTGIPTTVQVEPGCVPDELNPTVYLVCAELLSNVTKHSQAGAAFVGIRRDGPGLVVEVTDDGRGGADMDGGSGLRGIADRVASLGGQVHLGSDLGSGTSVRVDLPVGPVPQASPTRTHGNT